MTPPRRTLAALAAALLLPACNVTWGLLGDGGPPADTGPGGDAGAPPDTGPTADAGLTDDGGDNGPAPWCGSLAPPDAPNLCCHSCTVGSGSCQANGCYGGWYCDVSACKCNPPPTTCASGADGGTTGAPGPGTWPPTTGVLACTSTGAYDPTQNTGRCGSWRWSIKTGTDTGASAVDQSTVVQTTVAALRALPAPGAISGTGGGSVPRQSPDEATVYELRDVTLTFAKLEDDSDYHLVVGDASGTMIVEVPFPGCVGDLSPFGCNISQARALVDLHVHPSTSARTLNEPVSVVGVGFFDAIHGQTGVAPNGFELHPVLRICFGAGCDPLAAP